MMCRIALEIQLIFSTFIPIFSVIMIHPIRFFPFSFLCCHVCTALSRCHVVTLSRCHGQVESFARKAPITETNLDRLERRIQSRAHGKAPPRITAVAEQEKKSSLNSKG